MTSGLMTSASTAHFASAPDRVRMQRDRMRRIHDAMRANGLDVLVLLGNSNVAYATGLARPLADAGRGAFERPVAVVLLGDPTPHLFTGERDDTVDALLPADHLHGPGFLEFDEGVQQFVAALSGLVSTGSRIGFDEWTHAMRRDAQLLFAADAPGDASAVMGAAKLVKTADELAFMRDGLRITERAVAEVHRRLAPGVRQSELNAVFLGAIFEAGAEANVMDPIWQVMPRSIADGPWTTTGDVACPLLTTERTLERGDVLWVDVSLTHGGFHSDFGRTWIVGDEPDARQRAQFDRWREIVGAALAVTKAGARSADLTSAASRAAGIARPWLPHFYLAHGLGIDSAEMPFIGSDIGQAFDEQYVLQSGMVLVFEPIVWEDGAAGYRSEEIVVVTDDGWIPMTDYPYDPF